jgi:hypothetical protein
MRQAGGVTVGVVLPNELVWVLGAIGVTWPNIDEDELRHAGDEFRKLSSDLSAHKAGALGEIEQMLHVNSSESLKVFEALWEKVVKGHLSDLEEGLNILAGAMDTCAVIVEGMKVAAIAELVAFAAETAADVAAAVATAGIAAAGEVALEIATQKIVNGIIQQAIDQVEYQIKQALLAPVIDTLTSAGLNLGEQLLGNALGVQQGVDLGGVLSAAQGGLGQGLNTAGSQFGSMATDPLGPGGLGITSPGQLTKQDITSGQHTATGTGG